MIAPLYIIFLVTFIKGQPCEDSATIDITTGRKFQDGSVVYNHISFPANLVFERNVSGEFRIYGCVCRVRSCFRKCCELSKVMNIKTKSCVDSPKDDKLLISGLDLYYMNAYQKNVAVDKDFTLFFGWPCRRPNVYIEDSDWFVQEVIIYNYFICNKLKHMQAFLCLLYQICAR